ncbi:MAG TPA: AI-2E family transporter [Terriglobales bacterium]|nr:AI-2E family transporter [Terriglobales bacterium]
MSFPERRTANILMTILFFAVLCAAVYSARRIILLFVLAIFFAYLLNPVVKFLQSHSLFFRNLRGPAVVEVYLAFLILIGVLGYLFAPGAARRTVKFMDQVPVVMDGLATGNIAGDLRQKYDWSEEQEIRFRAFLARHREGIQSLVPTVDRYISNAAQIIGWSLLIPVLAIFFLRDGQHIADVLIRILFPSNRYARVWTVANDLHEMLTRYVRAQLLLCGLSFLFYLIALLLLGFPHAILFASLGGVLEFIPVAGWITTFATIVGVGLLNHCHWLWMAALLLIWRVIQDYFATPRIMGSHLKIHPLAAIFAVLVGAEIGGIVGVYLAVPLMAALRLIFSAYAGERTSRGHYHHFDAAPEVPSSLAETAIS